MLLKLIFIACPTILELACRLFNVPLDCFRLNFSKRRPLHKKRLLVPRRSRCCHCSFMVLQLYGLQSKLANLQKKATSLPSQPPSHKSLDFNDFLNQTLVLQNRFPKVALFGPISFSVQAKCAFDLYYFQFLAYLCEILFCQL